MIAEIPGWLSWIGFVALACIGAIVGSWAVVLYCLPTLIAQRRRHHNLTAIKCLNLLFGWTLIGWGVALVWALTVPAERPSS